MPDWLPGQQHHAGEHHPRLRAGVAQIMSSESNIVEMRLQHVSDLWFESVVSGLTYLFVGRTISIQDHSTEPLSPSRSRRSFRSRTYSYVDLSASLEITHHIRHRTAVWSIWALEAKTNRNNPLSDDDRRIVSVTKSSHILSYSAHELHRTSWTDVRDICALSEAHLRKIFVRYLVTPPCC